jgi:ATP-binding cassette subfamily B protein
VAEQRRLFQRPQQLATTVRAALRLTTDAAPAALRVGLLVAGAGALIPPFVVWLGKRLVDEVIAGSRGTPTTLDDVIPTIIALGLATALQRVLAALLAHRDELFATSVELFAERRLLDRMAAADLGYFESSDWHDRASRAMRDLAWRPYGVAHSVLALAGSIVGLVAMLGLLTTLNPLVTVLVVASVVPVALAQRRINLGLYEAWNATTTADRQRRYVRDLLSEPETAKEVRAFGLADHLLGRHQEVSDGRLSALRRFHSRADRILLPAAGVGGVFVASAYALVADGGLSGNLTVGDLALVIGAFAVVTGQLGSFLSSIFQIDQSAAFLADYFSFLELPPLLPQPQNPVEIPARLESGVRFDGISFKYPGPDSALALSGLHLEIQPGELIALVGENGAGKSTLVKLLLRFYDPDHGCIRVGGVDLREVESAALRSRVGVLFQDFARPEVSVRENVGLGRVEREPTDDAVMEALVAAHADYLVPKMRDGLDTNIGRLFEGGHDLSGGEWQRLALARLMFRQADIWVLDEPTSSLDAEVEAAIFSNLREQLRGRIGIVISHRFSTVRVADRIAVMAGGRITELGTHDELIALRGTYARLFELQASAYR